MSNTIDQDRLDNFRFATTIQVNQRDYMNCKQENALLTDQVSELTKKLAEQQAVGRSMKCQCVCGGEEELTKLLAEARKVPEGWRLVPVEPTDEMRDAALDFVATAPQQSVTVQNIYRVMLSAAPKGE